MANSKKKILTIIAVALIVLPIVASLRRAWMLKYKSGGVGFEDQTFVQVFWNSLVSKYS